MEKFQALIMCFLNEYNSGSSSYTREKNLVAGASEASSREADFKSEGEESEYKRTRMKNAKITIALFEGRPTRARIRPSHNGTLHRPKKNKHEPKLGTCSSRTCCIR